MQPSRQQLSTGCWPSERQRTLVHRIQSTNGRYGITLRPPLTKTYLGWLSLSCAEWLLDKVECMLKRKTRTQSPLKEQLGLSTAVIGNSSRFKVYKAELDIKALHCGVFCFKLISLWYCWCLNYDHIIWHQIFGSGSVTTLSIWSTQVCSYSSQSIWYEPILVDLRSSCYFCASLYWYTGQLILTTGLIYYTAYLLSTKHTENNRPHFFNLFVKLYVNVCVRRTELRFPLDLQRFGKCRFFLVFKRVCWSPVAYKVHSRYSVFAFHGFRKTPNEWWKVKAVRQTWKLFWLTSRPI